MNKIYCINNQSGICSLTIGKEYEMRGRVEDSYIIKNDDGFVRTYLKNKFTTSKELSESILDIKVNPNNYYQPVEIALNISHNIEHNQSTLGLTLLNIDDDINGVGNIYGLLNIKPSYNIIISSSSRNADYNKTSSYVQLGKSKGYMATIKNGTNSNIIDLAYRIQKSIDEINKVLVYKKKEKKLAYLIEHEPNGKKYHFKSELFSYDEGATVICDTMFGEKYGIVVGTEYVSESKYNKLARFRLFKKS